MMRNFSQCSKRRRQRVNSDDLLGKRARVGMAYSNDVVGSRQSRGADAVDDLPPHRRAPYFLFFLPVKARLPVKPRSRPRPRIGLAPCGMAAY